MVVIIGIVVVLATGIIAGTSVSLSRAQDSTLRTTAVKYAQEGVELARQRRDEGWLAFAALGAVANTYCVGDDNEFIAAQSCTTPNVGNQYIRSMTLELLNAGSETSERMRVTVTVSWGDVIATPNKAVTLTTDLTQWR